MRVSLLLCVAALGVGCRGASKSEDDADTEAPKTEVITRSFEVAAGETPLGTGAIRAELRPDGTATLKIDMVATNASASRSFERTYDRDGVIREQVFQLGIPDEGGDGKTQEGFVMTTEQSRPQFTAMGLSGKDHSLPEPLPYDEWATCRRLVRGGGGSDDAREYDPFTGRWQTLSLTVVAAGPDRWTLAETVAGRPLVDKLVDARCVPIEATFHEDGRDVRWSVTSK